MKQFYVTIAMRDSLSALRYSYSDGSVGGESKAYCFPGVVMIKDNLAPGDEYEIIPILTHDVNGYWEKNYDIFLSELESIREEMGLEELCVNEPIVMPHEESDEKQVAAFEMICKSIRKNSDIYMDLTYGSKLTCIAEFTSLTYAEKAMFCIIKKVLYGENKFDNSGHGTIYDVRALFQISGLISSLSILPDFDITRILEIFNRG